MQYGVDIPTYKRKENKKSKKKTNVKNISVKIGVIIILGFMLSRVGFGFIDGLYLAPFGLGYLISVIKKSNIKESNLELLKLKELKQGFMYNPTFYKDDITSFKDLNKYPLILQKTQSNSRKLLDYISLNNNVILKPKMEVVSQDLITEFVNIGLGIGFVIIDLANKKFDNLKELHINKKIPNINIYLATNKSISLTFASKTFIKYLK